MTEQKLKELGFENIPKANADETWETMEDQVYGNSALGVAVLDELIDWHAPESVCKDNHEAVLNMWLEEQVEALHREM